jgi:small-conductance mechanosensitive channel
VLASAADGYTLDELLEIAAASRAARTDAEFEELEVEREQRVLDGTTQRRDLAFKEYANATGDARWLAALRLIQARSAQAISTRRLDLLSLSHEREFAHAESLAQRVELAQERLIVTTDQAGLDELIKLVASNEAAVAEAEEQLRGASVAAVGLDLDTIEGRSQQRLEQQRQLGAEVELARAQVALARAQAQHWWTALQMDQASDNALLQEQILGWSELERDIGQRQPDWRSNTEDELLAVQSVNRDEIDRALRRLLDQRLGTAQETLSHIRELGRDIAELDILSQVAKEVAAENTGAFRSWLSTLSRQAKTLFLRASNLGEVTLFSIGESPITGGDILRVLIILVFAFLLSRGIRATIKRVGESDNAGTQASFYTVGRLTHYTIVILAMFIALSTIGLDFSNLALVAGALGVGVGFGLQSIVSNFVSGLIILFEHTLRVGDYIELDTGLTGTVKAINVRSTLINTNDNIDIVVPNSEFVTARLTNWTLGERVLRVRIPFGVAYGSDKELVKKAALEAAAEVPYTLTHMRGREPDVWLVDFGDSSLNFLMLVWVNRQGARRPTRTRAAYLRAAYLWALDDKLSEYGIEIPFPQRDLHIRSDQRES